MWTCDSTFVHIDKATDKLVMEPRWRILWDLRSVAARKDRPFEVTPRGCTWRAAQLVAPLRVSAAFCRHSHCYP